MYALLSAPMAGDRFKSPIVTAMARRQLFDGPDSGSIRAGQSLLASPTKVSVVSGPNNKQQIIIAPATETRITLNQDKPKKTGSLGLFFRKVYHISHLRLETLCHALEISEEGKRKIWTTFEHALREETDLMKDRHLDQILMCSLYIVCRVRTSRLTPVDPTSLSLHFLRSWRKTETLLTSWVSIKTSRKRPATFTAAFCCVRSPRANRRPMPTTARRRRRRHPTGWRRRLPSSTARNAATSSTFTTTFSCKGCKSFPSCSSEATKAHRCRHCLNFALIRRRPAKRSPTTTRSSFATWSPLRATPSHTTHIHPINLSPTASAEARPRYDVRSRSRNPQTLTF